MNKTRESQQEMTLIQKATIILSLALFMVAFCGTLFASIWFLPSPWCYTGALIAGGVYWIIQRAPVAETVMIVVLLLVVIAILRGPILHLKGYMNIQGESTVSMTQRTKGKAG